VRRKVTFPLSFFADILNHLKKNGFFLCRKKKGIRGVDVTFHAFLPSILERNGHFTSRLIFSRGKTSIPTPLE
jgi:hypothetical protein